MKGLAMMLAKKMPPPGGARASEGDDMPEESDEDTEGGEPADEGDEGSEAADMSAMEDFFSAYKAGKPEQALAALKDIIRNCMADEKGGDEGY